MNTPKLDLLIVDTYNPKLLGIVDISTYPVNFNITSPTIEITISGFNKVTVAMTAKSLNLFDTNNLGITCDAECTLAIPDGIIKLKYSIFPASEYFVEKTFIRVDGLQEKFDTAYMSLDMLECDRELSLTKKRQLDEIYTYLQLAIASANKGSLQLASSMYQKADKQLTKFLDKTSCNGTVR